jgi:hypothetical protein
MNVTQIQRGEHDSRHVPAARCGRVPPLERLQSRCLALAEAQAGLEMPLNLSGDWPCRHRRLSVGKILASQRRAGPAAWRNDDLGSLLRDCP